MAKYGYARVSTNEQELSLQLDALIKAGCSKSSIYTDKISGSQTYRPGLNACLKALRGGDTLLVWRLDRLGRSMTHLISTVGELRERGVAFQSICDGMIDTTTASGELIFNIFSTLAQFERRLIQERTCAGLAAARARGRTGGRKSLDPNDPRVLIALTLSKNKKLNTREICNQMKISKSTFYRLIKVAKVSNVC